MLDSVRSRRYIRLFSSIGFRLRTAANKSCKRTKTTLGWRGFVADALGELPTLGWRNRESMSGAEVKNCLNL